MAQKRVTDFFVVVFKYTCITSLVLCPFQIRNLNSKCNSQRIYGWKAGLCANGKTSQKLYLNRINFMGVVWKLQLHVLNISYTHTPKLQSQMFCLRGVCIKFFLLALWVELLTSMRFSNPRQRGFFFHGCIHVKLLPLFMESKCLEALKL